MVVFCCGLQVWEDVGVFFFGWLWSYEFEESSYDGEFFWLDFAGWCECSEGGVGGGFFDELWFFCVVVAAFFGDGFGEVEGGDLEAVEEQAGSSGVDFVGGDALEDFSDGGLDGGAVFGQGEGEGVGAAASGLWVYDGFARGVVVVAELFGAEGGALAAAAVGEDVAALVAFWFCCVGHNGAPPSPGFVVQSLLTIWVRVGLQLVDCLVKCEGPAFGRACLSLLWFYFIKCTITNDSFIFGR